MFNTVHEDEQRRKFHALDGMRGVAAFAVLLLHTPLTGPLPIPGRYLAVDLFFLLSGFVLAHSYQNRIGKSLSASRFMVMRLIRLYPLYILGTLICIPIRMYFLPLKARLISIPLAFAFLPTLLPTLKGVSPALFPFNSPAWSLFYELIANLAFALIVRRLKLRLLAAILILSAIVLFTESLKRNGLDLGAVWESKLGGIVRVAFSFFAGIAAYRLWRTGIRLPALPPVLMVFMPLILFLIPGPRAFIDIALVFLAFPALILCGASSDPSSGRLSKLFTISGEISYPLYALQYAGLSLFRALFPYSFDTASGSHAIFIGCAFLMCMPVFSWIAYVMYDTPIRRWLNGRINKPMKAS